MTKFAQLVSAEEGFGLAGEIPTLRRNPGDLRHSPHSQHTVEDPNAIGIIDTVADGWAENGSEAKVQAFRQLYPAKKLLVITEAVFRDILHLDVRQVA